ncbi:MAG TPA: hypothetical protein VEA16_13990 [Vicinamibacterales bacterium]|nr:hypothetical protein [Vicinamibacterales bacterium]
MSAPSNWTLTPTVPKWSKSDELYPDVPWLWRSDFDEGRTACWEIADGCDRRRISCWSVQTYHQQGRVATDFMILTATRGNGNDGGEIALALSGTARYDAYAKESFALAQSNPRRHPYRSDATYHEDGA